MKRQALPARRLWTAAGPGSLLLAVAATIGLAAGAAAALPTGADIPSRFGAGSLLATQTVPTGFGNNLSELNQLFVKTDGTNLNIGITGNIENNGNGAVMLLDTKSGGSSAFNYTGGDASGRINELNGDTLDAGFAPEFAVDVNNSGGTLYVDLYDLQANTKTYLGNAIDGDAAGALTGGGSVAFNNGNTAGVSDTAAVDGDGYPLAASATTGIELSLPLSQIGATSSRARIMAVVMGSGGYVSNQLLPGLPDTSGNLAGGPTNYQGIPGDQNAQFGLAVTANDLSTGSVPWAYTPVYLSGSGNNDAHPPVTSIPTVHNGVAYVAEDVVANGFNHTANIAAINTSASGTAHLVTTFGTKGRVTGLDGPITGRIAVYATSGTARLYAMTTNGTLYVLDAGTGANLRSLAIFPGGKAASTPAVISQGGSVNIIVAGKTAGGDVQLVRVLDLPTLAVDGTLNLTGATDVSSSPSVIADGSRIQIAATAGVNGEVYTVSAADFTVYNMADSDGPVTAAPTLTLNPPGLMVVGDVNGASSTLRAFNASNAAPVWSFNTGSTVRYSAFLDYASNPNKAYVGTQLGFFGGVNVSDGSSLPGFPGEVYPPATGSPLLLKPSSSGAQGSLYLPTASGMFVADAASPTADAAGRYPISARLTSASATGTSSGSVLAVSSDIGAGTTETYDPTGFTGGNVYGLAVQAAPAP